MSGLLSIAAVSYANTFPFVYGIENTGSLHNYKLVLLPPAQCATCFAAKKADIALVPAGALPEFSDYKIITNFCIGAVNEVKTVLLLSNKCIGEVKSIGLDIESATSVRLVRILAKHYWKIFPQWRSLDVNKHHEFKDTDAFVVIGDKAIGFEEHFAYKKDLAAEWQRFTGLPFVFAVWVSRKDLPEHTINEFSSALQYGIDHIDDVVIKYQPSISAAFDLATYYSRNIDYRFDDTKRNSLRKFLNFVASEDL